MLGLPPRSKGRDQHRDAREDEKMLFALVLERIDEIRREVDAASYERGEGDVPQGTRSHASVREDGDAKE